MGISGSARAIVALALAAALTSCSDVPLSDEPVTPEAQRNSAPPVSPRVSSPAATPSPGRSSTPAPRRTPNTAPAVMSIPSIGVSGLRVVPYTGSPDDGPGTRIQNGGVAANPQGPRGGVGPGDVGNYIVTGHRLSKGGPFRELPSVRNGDHILVTAGGKVYDYVVTGTMSISFRKPADLARQSAAVPGFPGRKATRPMITLSTCATIEDHAAGNFWKDEFDNPEHRIDKIGVLVAVRPA